MKTESVVVVEKLVFDTEVVLWVRSQTLAQAAKPGQFCMVSCTKGSDPFLQRAISIHAVKNDKVAFNIQMVGMVTQTLGRLVQGDQLQVLGPLGNGFQTDFFNKRLMLIGGGIGKAPLRYLADVLHQQGNHLIFLFGSREKNLLHDVESWCHFKNSEVHFATEDGSLGVKGHVTSLMSDLSHIDGIFACGPTPMLKAIQALINRLNISCQLSLEGHMACGMGVCLGCTCKRSDENAFYAKVCTDGPVFLAQEVDLND